VRVIGGFRRGHRWSLGEELYIFYRVKFEILRLISTSLRSGSTPPASPAGAARDAAPGSASGRSSHPSPRRWMGFDCCARRPPSAPSAPAVPVRATIGMGVQRGTVPHSVLFSEQISQKTCKRVNNRRTNSASLVIFLFVFQNSDPVVVGRSP
jgi:hypothetical protein